MSFLLLSCLLAPPWADSQDFPRQKQEQVLEATLRLRNPKTNGQGTAVRIGRIGSYVYYVTANHCLNDTTTVDLEPFTVKNYPKPEAVIPGVDVKFRSLSSDLAILRAMEPDGKQFLRLAPSASNASSFLALSAGCSDGAATTLQVEAISSAVRVTKKGEKMSVLHWPAKAIPAEGRSGGPLVDKNLGLMGICSGTDRKNGYYIHLEEIRKLLDEFALKPLYQQKPAGEVKNW